MSGSLLVPPGGKQYVGRIEMDLVRERIRSLADPQLFERLFDPAHRHEKIQGEMTAVHRIMRVKLHEFQRKCSVSKLQFY